MGINFVEVFSLLSQTPGSLIHHLVICLVWLWIVTVSAINLSQNKNRQSAQRLLIGAVILLALQIAALLMDFILFPSGSKDPSSIYILSQKFAGTLTFLWLSWIFLQERKPLGFTKINIFITLALIFLFGESIIFSLFQVPGLPNLENWLPVIWDGISLALILYGITAAMLTKPDQRAVSLAILLTLALGHILSLLVAAEPNVSLGAGRLAQLLSLPWSLILLQRLPRREPELQKFQARLTPYTQKADPTPALVDELLRISLQESSAQRAEAVARALSYSVIADICYIAQIPDGHAKIKLIAGYDLIREENAPAVDLPRDKLPRIMNAWEALRSLALSGRGSSTPDAETFTALLRYPHLGNLLAVPLCLPERGLEGGVIFLSPYTDKVWDEKVHLLMDRISPTLSRVLFDPLPFERIQADLASAEAAVDDLLAEKNALTRAFTRLGTTIETQEGTLRQLKARFQVERMEHVKQLQDYHAQIDALQAQVDAHQNQLADLEQLQAKIRHITKERDDLQVSLSRLNARIRELEGLSGQTGPVRLSMVNQVLSLNSILASLKHARGVQLQEKNLHLEVLNPDGEQIIKIDPSLLEIALEGLLDNAAGASRMGSKIQISQELSFETGMLIVQITDFGEGLTSEEQRAFFSGAGTTPPGIGSLASIREAIRAIRLLNGKIWIKSEKGHFTTFRVQIPVRIID